MAGIPQVGVTITTVLSTISLFTRSLPPLTTTFTYPSSCTNRWLQLYPDDPSLYTVLYSSIDYGDFFTSCQPGAFTDYPYYSPGICPGGQTIATISEYSSAFLSSDANNRQWLAYCCASGFAIDPYSVVCTSEMSSSAALAYRAVKAPYTTSVYSGSTYTGFTSDYDATSNTTTVSYASFIADPVGILWKASDLSLFEPTYASLLASRLNIPFTPSPTPSSSFASPTASPGSVTAFGEPTAAPPPPDPSPHGLSTGAKAGIGVGAVVGVLALAALIFLLLRWRKRKATLQQVSQGDYATTVEHPELVQYHNPGRKSQALSGTYSEHVGQTPTSPRNMP